MALVNALVTPSRAEEAARLYISVLLVLAKATTVNLLQNLDERAATRFVDKFVVCEAETMERNRSLRIVP